MADLIRNRNSHITEIDCICNACRINYSNKLKDLSYTPKKSRKKERQEHCFLSHVSLCAELSQVESCIPVKDFNETFHTDFQAVPDPVPLCQKHRVQISNFHKVRECAVCGHLMRPVHEKKMYKISDCQGVDFERLSLINDRYVQGDDDIMCRQCYNFSTRKSTCSETLSISDIETQLDTDSTDEGPLLEKLCCITYKQICTWCRDDAGFLLTDAYEFYLGELEKNCDKTSEEYDDLSRSRRWLMSRIVSKFGDAISIHKSSKKKGRFIYVSGVTKEALIESLHNAHNKVRSLMSKGKHTVDETIKSTPEDDASENIEHAFRKLIIEGNTRLKVQVKNNNEHYTKNPLSIDNFKFGNALSSFDPLIWNLVMLLTASNAEMSMFKKTSFCVASERISFSNESIRTGKLKEVRRAVVMFLLQFIVNETCLYPLQIITANVIKRLSHSSQLLRIMNRLGFSSSESTLERLLQLVEDEQDSTGSLVNMNPNAMTCVSIDNIDVLAPYAAVRPNQSRSWHGTSIMCQQPKPESEVLHDKYEKLHDDSQDVPSSSQVVPRSGRPSARKKLKLSEPIVVQTKDFFQPTLYKTYIPSQVTWDAFVLSKQEEESIMELEYDMLLYICERSVNVQPKESDLPLIPSFKCKLLVDSDCKSTEQSLFSYLRVLDQPADSPQTLKHCIQLLYDTFKVTVDVNHLVVIGDGATFKMLCEIKREYGDALEWLIPYIGDWHLLKNYQEVLMKLFWDAGLKSLAKSVHKNLTLQSLANCSNFKRTHRFFLQVHESIFALQFLSFLDQRKEDAQIMSNTSFMKEIESVVQSFEIDDNGEVTSTYKNLQNEVLSSSLFKSLKNEFEVFCKDMSEKLETFRFWNRFVHEDCMSYIHLFIAIRSRNWNLRNAAIKNMAALFHACDRQNYAKMIPLHINMMQGLPVHVKIHFENGAFVSSIKGINFSSVAFDEAHEMLINKECKMAISRSLPQNMEKIASTIQYQAKVIHNFENELDISLKTPVHRDLSPSVIQSEFANVKLYFGKLFETKMFLPDQTPQLHHVFTEAIASKEQQACLLNYRKIGVDAYTVYCKYQILKDVSNKKPVVHRHNLKTFAKSKVSKRKITSLEKEKKMITMCYKRTIAYSEERGQPISSLLQFVEKPRAICDSNNMPHKGAKWVMYDIFDKRYGSKFDIVTCTPCLPLTEACFIAEGMNIIYTSPLRLFKTFSDYAAFLVARWILPYFKKGCKEIRILFDQFDTQGVSPKLVERSRRDKSDDDCDVVYSDIGDDTVLPPNWHKFLKVRSQKHLLIRYLSQKFIGLVQGHLQEGQSFLTSGGFHVGLVNKPAWSGVVVSRTDVVHHALVHNHEESDTQIFLHVFDSTCTNILIYSIDRDVGMVALPLDLGAKNVCLQYRAKAGDDRFLNINLLQEAIRLDSDFSPVINNNLDILKCIQSLYICSGCDFVSYFCHLGKSIFFNTFAQFANFISGESTANLGCTNVSVDSERGLLSFLRLILCVYFKVNRACLHNYDSPRHLFNTLTVNNPLEHHHKALEIVRKASWKGVYEDQLLPSHCALQFHWLRACWVSSVWGKCTTPIFMYPDITHHGFRVTKDEDSINVEFIWDSDENIKQIQNNVAYLTRGCSCKKSKCVNKQCKCKKEGKHCGPGCTCRNCTNLANFVEGQSSEETDDSDSDIEGALGDSDDDVTDCDDDILDIDYVHVTQDEGVTSCDVDIAETSDDDVDLLEL